MVLTKKQESDLNLSILAYLKDHNFTEAFEALKGATNTDDASIAAVQARLLEKKWTSVVRLQKKVLLLEQKNRALEEKCQSLPSPVDSETSVNAVPREPARFELAGHRQPITCVRFHQSQTILATASDDTTIRLWDYELGRFERSLKGHTDAVQDLCFSPKGDILASCSADLSIRLWDLTSYRCVKTLQGHDHNVSSISFMPSGDRLISCSRDMTIKVWDVSSGYCIATLKGHEKWVRSVRVSPDGSTLASGSMDKTIRLWTIATGKCEHVLREHSHVIESIAFSNVEADKTMMSKGEEEDDSKLQTLIKTDVDEVRGGAYLVSASRDNSMRVWEVATGICLQVLSGHDSWVRSVLYHPGGRYIVSSSDDKTIRCWDLKQNFKCTSLIDDAHELFVTTIDWNPLTPLLASGGVDNHVKIWECR